MSKDDLPNLPPAGGVMWLAQQIHSKTPYIYDKAKTFWLWKGSHYEIVDKDDMLGKIYEETIDEKFLSGQFKAAALNAIKITGRKTVVKDKPKGWVHFKNCIIDIDSWERLKPNPEYLLTEPIPHNFIDSTDTPTIDAFFKSWVEEKYVQTLYEVCAYTMLDDYPIHRVFLLYGSGRNGKGQFRKILTEIVGNLNTTALTLEGLSNNRFESARLYKNKLCTLGETNFSLLEKTSMFKMATGGDMIPGEFKNGNPFTFENTAKMVINTNSLPQTTDKTEGFYSRWVILNFANQFMKGKDVVNQITPKEYDCLVSKLMYILRDLRERGEFHEEGTVKEKMILYEEVSNPLSKFIEAHCTDDINDSVPLKHFKEAFTVYLKENGFRVYTDKSLRSYIENEGYTIDNKMWFANLNKQFAGIEGLDLKNKSYIEENRESDGTLGDF